MKAERQRQIASAGMGSATNPAHPHAAQLQICVKEMHTHLTERLCAQSCLTCYDPMDCSPLGSSLHGILQARILEWAAISFSRGKAYGM